jgi:hypothetical protein
MGGTILRQRIQRKMPTSVVRSKCCVGRFWILPLRMAWWMASSVGRARRRHRVHPKIPRQNHFERAARNIRAERAAG